MSWLSAKVGFLTATLLAISSQLPAADDLPLTGAHALSRLARQPAAFRPPILQMGKKGTRLQLAMVIDGTTSMKRELEELAVYLKDLPKLYGNRRLQQVFVAVIVYRDSRAPSGSVTMLSDFTSDIAGLSKKIAELKPETGEPYFPEAMDQGLHTALTGLSWPNADVKAERRILIMGDAPPYAVDHENRKFHDAELNQRAADGKITIDALLVNSGFPLTDDGVVGTSRETATKAAPYAREFLTAITSKTSGTFLDLWNEEQIGTLLVPTIVLNKVGPVPKPDLAPEPTLEAWQEILSNRFVSVRGERPALRGIAKLVTLKPQPVATTELFPVLWSEAELKEITNDLTESSDEEPDNGLIHLLLANLHGLSAAADGVEDHAQAVVEHVRLAHEQKNDHLPDAMRDEIDALYELYINGKPDAALSAFKKLNSAKADKSNPGCQLRAAWACLALEAGFWPASGNGEGKPVHSDRCRDLVLQILKHHPDSVEAQALKQLVENAVSDRVEIPKTLFVIPRSN